MLKMLEKVYLFTCICTVFFFIIHVYVLTIIDLLYACVSRLQSMYQSHNQAGGISLELTDQEVSLKKLQNLLDHTDICQGEDLYDFSIKNSVQQVGVRCETI